MIDPNYFKVLSQDKLGYKPDRRLGGNTIFDALQALPFLQTLPRGIRLLPK